MRGLKRMLRAQQIVAGLSMILTVWGLFFLWRLTTGSEPLTLAVLALVLFALIALWFQAQKNLREALEHEEPGPEG